MIPIAWKGDHRPAHIVLIVLLLFTVFVCTMCGPNMEFKPGGMFRKDRGYEP